MFGRRVKNNHVPQEPRADELSSDELAWRDNQLLVAALIAERYTGASEPLPTLERLDACVAGWLADDDTRVDVNTLVNAAGIAFGAHLAQDAVLDWVIATDDQGSDLALHGEPGNIFLFPANAVAKRVTAGEVGFIVSLHHAMVGAVEQQRAQGQASSL
jgi:hypothetical protein